MGTISRPGDALNYCFTVRDQRMSTIDVALRVGLINLDSPTEDSLTRSVQSLSDELSGGDTEQ